MEYTLEELTELLKQRIDEYESLCEQNYRTSYKDVDLKQSIERQLRLLRLNEIYPLKHQMLDIIVKLMREAEDRAWARAKEDRNGTS